jgi:hypothetical protein
VGAAAALAAGAAVCAIAAAGHPAASTMADVMTSVPSGSHPASGTLTASGHAAAHPAAASSGTASFGTASSGTAAGGLTEALVAGVLGSQQALADVARQAASASTAAASTRPTAATLACNHSWALLPYNVTTIVSFLIGNGYSDNAAAGIAGNIYQESKGDPESIGMGGGGLISWTPVQPGLITGDAEADLQAQLAAILSYDEQWAAYLPALNDAATPADAAYIYVTYFERAGIPDTAIREASADNVAAACGI